jgi:hypothetical protein
MKKIGKKINKINSISKEQIHKINPNVNNVNIMMNKIK